MKARPQDRATLRVEFAQMAASPDGGSDGAANGTPDSTTKKGRGNWGAFYTWQEPVHVEVPRRLGCRALSCAGSAGAAGAFGRSLWTVSPRRDVPGSAKLEVLQEALNSDQLKDYARHHNIIKEHRSLECQT